MYWTLELASRLEDAPWPATKEELIDYATRSGAPLEVIENLEDLEDDGEVLEELVRQYYSRTGAVVPKLICLPFDFEGKEF